MIIHWNSPIASPVHRKKAWTLVFRMCGIFNKRQSVNIESINIDNPVMIQVKMLSHEDYVQSLPKCKVETLVCNEENKKFHRITFVSVSRPAPW